MGLPLLTVDLGQLEPAFVDLEHKLLFRGIQKCASSVFHQLFLKLAGDECYDEPPYGKSAVTRLRDLPSTSRHEIFEDGSWTRAVVLRDPFERLISAYLHLIRDTPYPIALRGQLLGGTYPQDFGGFLETITRSSTQIVVDNVHWRPQVAFFPTSELFNAVLDFTHLHDEAERLLRRVGIWNEHCATGWGPGRSLPFLTSASGIHTTGAASRLTEFRPYLGVIRTLYEEDYALLASLGLHSD
ncbi:MAG: sulfotransferase family protein [bacterium]|nr:sulfotransferase family protein [bacterium]